MNMKMTFYEMKKFNASVKNSQRNCALNRQSFVMLKFIYKFINDNYQQS